MIPAVVVRVEVGAGVAVGAAVDAIAQEVDVRRLVEQRVRASQARVQQADPAARQAEVEVRVADNPRAAVLDVILRRLLGGDPRFDRIGHRRASPAFDTPRQEAYSTTSALMSQNRSNGFALCSRSSLVRSSYRSPRWPAISFTRRCALRAAPRLVWERRVWSGLGSGKRGIRGPHGSSPAPGRAHRLLVRPAARGAARGPSPAGVSARDLWPAYSSKGSIEKACQGMYVPPCGSRSSLPHTGDVDQTERILAQLGGDTRGWRHASTPPWGHGPSMRSCCISTVRPCNARVKLTSRRNRRFAEVPNSNCTSRFRKPSACRIA